MWQNATVEVPPDLIRWTTSVWVYSDALVLGVMKSNFLAPPWLWAKVLRGGFRNVRKAPGLLTEFQHMMNLETVYAEAAIDKPRDQAFLEYLGFAYEQAYEDRKIYSRSI
jgi:hypothetical protein